MSMNGLKMKALVSVVLYALSTTATSAAAVRALGAPMEIETLEQDEATDKQLDRERAKRRRQRMKRRRQAAKLAAQERAKLEGGALRDGLGAAPAAEPRVELAGAGPAGLFGALGGALKRAADKKAGREVPRQAQHDQAPPAAGNQHPATPAGQGQPPAAANQNAGGDDEETLGSGDAVLTIEGVRQGVGGSYAFFKLEGSGTVWLLLKQKTCEARIATGSVYDEHRSNGVSFAAREGFSDDQYCIYGAYHAEFGNGGWVSFGVPLKGNGRSRLEILVQQHAALPSTDSMWIEANEAPEPPAPNVSIPPGWKPGVVDAAAVLRAHGAGGGISLWVNGAEQGFISSVQTAPEILLSPGGSASIQVALAGVPAGQGVDAHFYGRSPAYTSASGALVYDPPQQFMLDSNPAVELLSGGSEVWYVPMASYGWRSAVMVKGADPFILEQPVSCVRAGSELIDLNLCVGRVGTTPITSTLGTFSGYLEDFSCTSVQIPVVCGN